MRLTSASVVRSIVTAMERPPARRGCGAFYGRGWRPTSAAFALVLVIYASFLTISTSANVTEPTLQTPSPEGASMSTPVPVKAMRTVIDSLGTNSLQKSTAIPRKMSLPSSSSPVTLGSTTSTKERFTSTETDATPGPVGSLATSVSSSPTPVATLSNATLSTANNSMVVGATKAPPSLLNNTSPTDANSSPRTATPAGYILVSGVTGPSVLTTKGTSASPKGDQTNVSNSGTTSGSPDQPSTAPPTATLVRQETAAVVTVLVKEITDAGESVTLVTPNATIFSGDGLDPDHEKEELKKLLLIVGCSIGAAVLTILLVFVIVYRVARRRKKKTNSRYYNFKKKKSSYERVLHLQDYHHADVDAGSSVGTGTAWVFQENDRQNAHKAITLEFDRQDTGFEKPVGKPGRKKKSKNKSKNNRNKTNNYRGNYQVLAEMFPGGRSVPPDVLLSVDGAVHSNDEEEDDAILDTSFGPVVCTTPTAQSGNAVVVMDTPVRKDSANEGARSPWPSWNTSPYVTITSEDAVVEL